MSDPFAHLFQPRAAITPLVASIQALVAKTRADMKADMVPPTLEEKEKLEARVFADYQSALWQQKTVDEYIVIHAPVAFTPRNVRSLVRRSTLVRVIETPPEMLYVWREGWIDPSWLVERVGAPSEDLLMICATGYGPNDQTFKF